MERFKLSTEIPWAGNKKAVNSTDREAIYVHGHGFSAQAPLG